MVCFDEPETWMMVKGGEFLHADEIALVHSGQKVRAIKAFRDRTGTGLSESVEIFKKWYLANNLRW